VVHGQSTPLVELAPALPPAVLAAGEHALQKDPHAPPPGRGGFIPQPTRRPPHSLPTPQPPGLEGAPPPPPAPRPGGVGEHPPPPGPAAARQSFDDAARSSAPTTPPPPQPRPAWPIVLASGIALMAGAIALGQWLAGRQAPQRTAALAPLEPTRQIPTPPP